MGKHRGIKKLVLFTLSLAGLMVRFPNLLGGWDLFCIVVCSYALSKVIETVALLTICSIKDSMKFIDIGWRCTRYLTQIILGIALAMGIQILMTDSCKPNELLAISCNIISWTYLVLIRIIKVGDNYVLMADNLIKISDISRIDKREITTEQELPRKLVEFTIELKNGNKYGWKVKSKYEHNSDILLDKVEVKF